MSNYVVSAKRDHLTRQKCYNDQCRAYAEHAGVTQLVE